jgi:choline kinase
MAYSRTSFVRRAVVLAAGNGDRFKNHSSHSKLLARVAGTPLLIHTLNAASSAGITDAHVVLGYDSEALKSLALSDAPSGLNLHFHVNREWHLENGLSVLTARPWIAEPFALMMGDHLFDPDVLRHLVRLRYEPGEALLCVDRRTSDPDVTAEATKVRLREGRVTAIGKTLDPYDALDTGLFLCQPSVFDALDESCRAGDSTLSGGIRRLAARHLVRGVDIRDAPWWDVDTVADLTAARQIFARALRA